MVLGSEDAPMVQLAHRIDRATSLWHVTWSPHGRMLWAYSTFAPINFAFGSSDANELQFWMRQVEMRYAPQIRPAGPEEEPVGRQSQGDPRIPGPQTAGPVVPPSGPAPRGTDSL